MTENAVNTAVTSTSSPAIPAETSAVSPATRAANRPLGTQLGKHPTRVLFLGAGELGKEVAIELMRLGAWVCAADSYAGAPAQQVAHEYRALDMANAAELQALFDEIKPDIIVPEVEAIATDVLAGPAAAGAQVVPSAEIAAICMDRERLRVLAHEELGLPTTPYRFAGSLEELRAGASGVGYPCVVKPVRARLVTASRWCVPPTPSMPLGPKRRRAAAPPMRAMCRAGSLRRLLRWSVS